MKLQELEANIRQLNINPNEMYICEVKIDEACSTSVIANTLQSLSKIFHEKSLNNVIFIPVSDEGIQSLRFENLFHYLSTIFSRDELIDCINKEFEVCDNG